MSLRINLEVAEHVESIVEDIWDILELIDGCNTRKSEFFYENMTRVCMEYIAFDVRGHLQKNGGNIPFVSVYPMYVKHTECSYCTIG